MADAGLRRIDRRYLVQTRHHGERGWRTQAVITDLDAAMREARRIVDLTTWARFRLYAFVQVMQGGQLVAAWRNGRPVTEARIGGAA